MPFDYNNMTLMESYEPSDFEDVPLNDFEKAPLSSCTKGVQASNPYISVVDNVVSIQIHTDFVEGVPNGATPADLIEFAHSLMATANSDFPVEENEKTVASIRTLMRWKNRRPV